MGNKHRPIRLAYVIDSLALHGVQKALVQLVRSFPQRAYQQRVYSLNDAVHPHNKNALLQCGSEVKVIGKLQLLTTIGLIHIVYDWILWKPDIVFTMLFYSDIIGRTIAKIALVPVIISSIRARNIYKNRVHFYLDKLTAQWVDKIIFNSKRVIPFSMQYEGIQEEQVVYIPNGVTITNNRIDQDKKCEKLCISKNTLIIGSVGRLALQKGYAYLLQAFQLIQRQIPNSILLIIGRGPLLEMLKALSIELHISDKVRLLGERTDVDELLACMDVYVQPSLFEGMPNALMEAMANGKPVVATQVDGMTELIEDGKTGWFVKPEHPEMLAEKICYVLKHPEVATKVGATAAERMAKEFSVEKMANAYDELFRELVSKKLRQQCYGSYDVEQ